MGPLLPAFYLRTFIVSLMLTIFVSCNHTPTDWQLVWNDEFNYTGLPDTSKWNFCTEGNTSGWGNNELQHYTSLRPENAFVNGQHLSITAIKEIWNDAAYTSARLSTKHKGDWLYGRIEICARIPAGRGIWPAIWMLPTDNTYGHWPRSGEIDIMEHVGYEPDSIYTTIHTEAFNHNIGTQKGKSTYINNCETDFHIYAIEWSPSIINFFIDDKCVYNFKNTGQGYQQWPFDKRFHLIINVAVGGNWGARRGVNPDIFPATMQIDYVRVYQK